MTLFAAPLIPASLTQDPPKALALDSLDDVYAFLGGSSPTRSTTRPIAHTLWIAHTH